MLARFEINMTFSGKPLPVPTVLVSRPGTMQQSLRASLASYLGINVVACSGDGLTALSQVRKYQPGLLVIDSNLLEEEATSLICTVKTEQPNIRCLVFVQAAHQRNRILSNGADAVNMRQSSQQQLQFTLDHLTKNAGE